MGKQTLGHQVGVVLLVNWAEVEEEVEVQCHL